MPKFKTPEEELDYLRAHVQKREAELRDVGHTERTAEMATRDLLGEYKSVPAEKIVHQNNLLQPKETENIVLRLKPETHDTVMEELLGIVITKGVRNALSVAAAMNNPHIDDDFHRFLVQYFKTGHIKGFKEGNPVYKSLNMTLFEVTLPPPEDEADKSQGFKEFIGAMEQFYAGMQSISEGKSNEKENYFTLEVALGNQSDEVVIYAAIPNKHLSLFEKQVLAFYHHAKLREITDDYNIFNETGGSAGAYASFSERPVLPLKTYDEIEHDPMNPILNVFSKLQTSGEGAAIQFLIAPAGDQFINEFHMILDDVKDGMSIKHASDRFYKFRSAFTQAGKELIFGVKETSPEGKNEKYMKGRRAVDEGAAEKIGNKVKSTIMKANIRVIASGGTRERAQAILKEIESSFNQFSAAASNSIIFEELQEGDLKKLFHDYSYRAFASDKVLPMNLKELASVFHFPVGVGNQPQLKEAKAGIAPAPIELGTEGIILGVNSYRGRDTEIHLAREDRIRHFYVIGQTGTGKTNIMLNMITQDIKNGDGCCYIDPHGTDIQTILSRIPKERIDDVIYFDPAYTARPMGLNML